ncbi:hypothetical protein A2U94_14615 [Bacillus sp. VT 712]|jgi:hypothetical protein|uniref:Uncharacterized protein n=2 Tax=Priestia TaxID=2800373 RepID=A0A0V8JM53_9BACI|nr:MULTISPECIES: hypothetical protein [Bacillaceae]AQX55498.1 hypothetical protein BC359_15105 [Priestia flexa]KSU88151.1 hypothetical protein AS180_09520 [Priestia veravalensis]KZB90745.1 hypothetical protein A2U94_14615 [Bacillus sp. VT 712]MBN8252621.1 hypothetical protein [Priestia flexa]MBN8434092.1 hypothetical protein [Priestia flexa]
MNETSVTKIILMQTEKLARQYGYDFLYEPQGDKTLCQIIQRDEDGSILGTPLSFHIDMNEEKGIGQISYYHEQGEFKKQDVSVFEENSLVNVFLFIQQRLQINS